MTPPIFNLGDEVETTNGTRFKISQIWKKPDGSLAYSDVNLRWFSAGDLRLVPAELKIGDWVEVIRPDIDATGKIAKVIRVEPPSDDKYNIQLEDKSWWRPTSLRKLTPEEIEQHLVKDLPSPKDVFESRIVAYCRATNDGNISIHERLSAIEKRLSAIETLQFSQQDAIVHFENRLTFVEKFQRDQDNLMGRAIRDGVAEILDFRRKA